MASKLCTVGGIRFVAMCLGITVVVFNLEGCGTSDNATALDPDPSKNTRVEALAMLNDLHETCSAKCDDKCTYAAKDLPGHVQEAIACRTCLDESCSAEFHKLQSQFAEHWDEPVCQKAIGDAAVCWADTSECNQVATTCWAQPPCDFAKLGQCWHDYTKKCLEEYLPCCYRDGDSSGEGSEGSTGSDQSGDVDPSNNMCYNDGTPGLTDSQCAIRQYGHDYAYSIPGSKSKTGCCKQNNAQQCTIISTPGGLDPGATFDCTHSR